MTGNFTPLRTLADLMQPPGDRAQEFRVVMSFADGRERICAINVPMVGWCPLVSADPSRRQWLDEQAEAVARETGGEVRVVTFTKRRVERVYSARPVQTSTEG